MLKGLAALARQPKPLASPLRLQHSRNMRVLRLTLFAGRCYSRRVPWTRVSVKTSGSWDCPSSLARVSPPQPNDSLQQSAKQAPHPPRTQCEVQQRGMTLFDETTAHNSESTSAVATETEPTVSD